MRFKLGKKGWLFEGIMFFIILIILTTAFFSLYKKYGQFPDGYKIGDRQFSLITAYQKGEAALFYIDQSAKYSLEQSVYYLAKSGGVSEIEVSDAETFAGHECGKFNDAYVWYQVMKKDGKINTKECFNENSAKDNLEIIGLATLPVNINIFKKEVPEDFSTAIRDVKPKPIDVKQLEKDTTKPSEGFRDFTGTDLCAKGSQCVLKEEAFQQLVKAQNAAVKKGISLEVYSAYRSSEKQQALWNGDTPERYAQRYPDPAVRVKYVCNPAGGEAKCPHLSGDVVDVRLKGKTTKTMSSADWNNLYSAMTSADSNKQPLWVKYSNEPWHFECCNTPRYARAIQQGVTSIV